MNTTTTTTTTADTTADLIAAAMTENETEATEIVAAADTTADTTVTAVAQSAAEIIAAADATIAAARDAAITADVSDRLALRAALIGLANADDASSRRTVAQTYAIYLATAQLLSRGYIAVTPDVASRVKPSDRTRATFAAAGLFVNENGENVAPGAKPSDAELSAFKSATGWGWGTIQAIADSLRSAPFYAAAIAELTAESTTGTPTARGIITRATRMMNEASDAKLREARITRETNKETADRDADALNKARPDVYAAIIAADEAIAVDVASTKVITAVGTVNEEALRGLRVMHAAGNNAGIAELIRLAQYAIANPWSPTVRDEDEANKESANEANEATPPQEEEIAPVAPVAKPRKARKSAAA